MLAAYVCTDIEVSVIAYMNCRCRGLHGCAYVDLCWWVHLALGGRRLPMHSMKACVCAPMTWGLCLDRSCRCTVQGRRRLARVQTMCVHSCVSWPRAGRTPRAPLASAERAALFLRRRQPRGLPARAVWAWASRGRRDWRPSGPLDSLPGGRSRIGSRYRRRRVGVGVAGGRQAIHLLLLQRNGAARAPAHLSSASFADNGHLSSLSSEPMSSAPLTGRDGRGRGGGGGGEVGREQEHRRAHVHVGLLDTRSCTYTQAHGTWGDTCPYVCGSRLPGDGHTGRRTLRTASSVKQILPAGDPLPHLRRRVLGGRGWCSWLMAARVQVVLGQLPACTRVKGATNIYRAPTGSTGLHVTVCPSGRV